MTAGTPTTRQSTSTVRVRYAETDQMGVAYHANYFVWFEVARTDWLRTFGVTYRDLEAEGYFLPVIDARCRVPHLGTLRRRLADHGGGPTGLGRARGIRLRGSTGPTSVVAVGHTVHAALDRQGRPVRVPGTPQGAHSMKALITGGAGFVGSHLSERLLAQGAEVVALDCFTDYYPRPLKEANVAGLRGRPGYRLVEAAIKDADLPALLDGVTHVFHLAAQAGVRKSWGADFKIYTELNIDATQILLEACVGRPLERVVYASSSSVYGDLVDMPMREDALPQPVSPYGVTKLLGRAALLPVPRRTSASPPCRCATSPSTVHASGPTWASTDSSRPSWPVSPSCSTATACRPVISPSWPTRRGLLRMPASGGRPGASTILAEGRG